MTGATLISSTIATAAVILLIIGFIHEEQIIEFEDKMILMLASMWKRHLRRRRIKQRAKNKAHLRVVPASANTERCHKSA